jgi:hypothetical protein
MSEATCAAMESVTRLPMHMNEEGFATPIKKANVPLSVSQTLSLPWKYSVQLFIHEDAY